MTALYSKIDAHWNVNATVLEWCSCLQMELAVRKPTGKVSVASSFALSPTTFVGAQPHLCTTTQVCGSLPSSMPRGTSGIPCLTQLLLLSEAVPSLHSLLTHSEGLIQL